ncbi:MAG TPA: hypothetical protein VF276_14780, partial [Chloroflexia bacterium]
MNDRYDEADRDRRLLAMIDELQAGTSPAPPTGEPLHDFAALLHGAAPEPDPGFQQKLDARLTAAVRDRTARAPARPGAVQRGPTLPGNAGNGGWRRLFRPVAGVTRGLA